MKPTYEELEQQHAVVIAENAGLKAAFSPKEILSEAVDAFTDTVTIDLNGDESGSWSYVENEAEVINTTTGNDGYLASYLFYCYRLRR